MGRRERYANFTLNGPTTGRTVRRPFAVHPIVYVLISEVVHSFDDLLSPVTMDSAGDLAVSTTYEVAKSNHNVLRKL